MTKHNLEWFSSVWHINTVNPWLSKYNVKDNDVVEGHICPYPEELVFRLVTLFSKKGDYVLDPFCGSGTTNYAALALFRRTIGYDIERKYIAIAKERCNNRGRFICGSSTDMEECYNNSIQLCVTSPPYLDLKKYSDNPDNIGNVKEPYKLLREVFEEVYRVLKKGGYFCMNVGGVPDGLGNMTTFPHDMIYMCLDMGFKFKHTIVWDKGVFLNDWNIHQCRMRENHEFVWVFEK